MPIIVLIEALAMAGLNLYTTIKGNSGDTALIARLLPVAASVYSSIKAISTTLEQAQKEGWTDDDPRWGPAFDAAHAAIDAAEAQL